MNFLRGLSACCFRCILHAWGFLVKVPPKGIYFECHGFRKAFGYCSAFLQAECTQTMLLQETRISPKCIESIRNRASKAGWVLHIGFQPPLSKVMGPKGFFRQPTGGLATLVHKQIPSAAIQFPQNLQYLHQYCLPIWLSVSNGRTGLVLVNCYLPTWFCRAGNTGGDFA